MATIRKLRGRWQAQVRRKGIAPRARSFDSKADAEKWARSLEAELDRCGTLADTRLAESMTLRHLLERYREEITPRKRSARSERFRINALLLHDIAHRTLANLSSADLAAYRDARLKVVAAATLIKELNLISHAIDTARKEWGVNLAASPMKMVTRPSPPRGRTRRLQGDEEQRLLDATSTGRNPWMRPLLVLAIETAMRRGELLNLTWQHVDLDRRVGHIPVTKTDTPRDVPLSSRAIAVLAELPRSPCGRVFPLSASAVQQAFEHLRARAGMQDLRFHDLRHEGVSRLFEKGLNVVEAAAISGHRELKMLARYTHLKAEDLAARLG